MRAVTTTAPGGPENLSLIETVENPPSAGEVQIRTVASGVNPADLLQRAGLYPPPPGASDLLGLELSGIVHDVGSGVTDVAVGDRVCALVDGGAYAELVNAPAAQVIHVPGGLELRDAAAVPEAACTAWSNLVDVAGLTAGMTVLIHGGSGGVGSMAVQIAHALNAFVISTAGGPERCEQVRALGADVVVDHRSESFVDVVLEVTGGRGVDVVLDVVGAAYLAENVRALATNGHLVVIGMQKGRRAELDLGVLLTKRASVTGTTLRSRPAGEKATIVDGVRRHVLPLITDGRVRPVVDTIYPFSEARQAHERLAAGGVLGKILLTP
ncbi:putative NAD(P)H quinone oxidoreductase, PIG3 family [Paraoerskovia marina]|uniref:Putative NAD(P)H quinone oxidoreductase, PIG3 family n=1 Tax=Paraoerskovia marina TaxID=545619 RepID=A0A1H1P4V7_9CELL|nr:NAD(P)H-quinone oxidoreductase [Paraoerskovia marina]SDS06070.1 putative NAD(P)H quinone oxidoreductase, PIG3 family [Paraoerskovia marina]